jgi:uncharacterized protein YkwD
LKTKNAIRWIGLATVIVALTTAGASLIAHAGPQSRPPTRTSISSPEPKLEKPARAHLVPRDPRADAHLFVALINRIRVAHKLRPLSIRFDLATVAGRWSARMAARRKISHNHNFRHEVHGWWLLGENVGWTNSSVDYLHRAFLASPEHRRNILDPRFTSIGVGEAISADGRIFVTEDFGRYSPY